MELYYFPTGKVIEDELAKIPSCFRVCPKSKLFEAVRYTLSYEKNFRLYLEHPDAKMHNNTAERAVKKIVLGRKIGYMLEVEEAVKLWLTLCH